MREINDCWAGSLVPKFDEGLVTQFVTVTAGIRAIHSNNGEMGGVLFLDRPLKFNDGFRYFEVYLEVICPGEQDGLTLGVTTRLPLESEERPTCADDVHFSWSIGYDGRAHIHGANDLVLTCWNPKELQVGDRIGFLVAGDGAACVLVNDARVVNLPGIVPQDLDLYGIIDLLGTAKGVSLVESAFPPESECDFCLQTVRDEALDSMYAALSSGSRELVKAAVLTARLVGIDETIIRQTERVVRAMPCFQPPPRGPPPPRPSQSMNSSICSSPPAASPNRSSRSTSSPGSNEKIWHSSSKENKGFQHLKPILEVPGSDTSPKLSKAKDLDVSISSAKHFQQLKPILESPSVTSPSPHSGSKSKQDTRGVCKTPVKALDFDPATPQKDGEITLEMLQRRGAEKLLADAWATGGLNSFRDAIHRAEAAKVKPSVLARARQGLSMLEKRSEAEQALVDALAIGEAHGLSAALNKAISANVDAALVAKAKDRLKLLDVQVPADDQKCLRGSERKKEVEKWLAESMASGDVQQLRMALRQAETESDDLGDAITATQIRLYTLESEVKSEAEKGLATALHSSDFQLLRPAIEKAKAANVDAGMINLAQQKLEDFESRSSAEKLLADALASGDAGRIKQALSEAKLAAVDSLLIGESEKHCEELERRGEASQNLIRALAGSDLDNLRNCIAEAASAQVHPELVLRANYRLEELERRSEEAWKRLDEVMSYVCNLSPPTVDALAMLDTAIDQVQACGCDVETLRAVSARLRGEMNAAVGEATEALQIACKPNSMQDAQSIQNCLEVCRSLGADEPIAEALSVIACQLRAAMESARHAEREERGEMLPGMESLLSILRENLHPELRKLHNDMQDLKGALRVFCRVRPLVDHEILNNDAFAVESPNQFTVTVTTAKKNTIELCDTSFNYDAVFTESSSQAEVFAECRSLIQSAFDGYNVAIFTYGQTGAGKTWTLYGSPEDPGICPRSCEEVFDVIERDRDKFEVSVTASMIELYNNTVCDLLSFQSEPPKVDIRTRRREDGAEVVWLDCSEVEVMTAAELNNAVDLGFAQRKVASTTMNVDSSRSHLLFMIKLHITDRQTGRSIEGKISIVDLAGSERISKSNATGEVQREAIMINKSLTALGDVMGAITSGAKLVPYRNNKLTMLMQDSLGGTAKTLMFVNLSPSSYNADETLSALKYASRARCIENEVVSHMAPTAAKNDELRRSRPSTARVSMSALLNER